MNYLCLKKLQTRQNTLHVNQFIIKAEGVLYMSDGVRNIVYTICMPCAFDIFKHC